MKSLAVMLVVVGCLLISACGTVGSVVTPTPTPDNSPMATATPTFTDVAKAEILVLFEEQVLAISGADWAGAYNICNPSYRNRRDVERFTNDVQRLLSRYETTAEGLDIRNAVVSKGRDDRFDLDYDLYIAGAFSQHFQIAAGYVFINGAWYDDGVWCR